MGSVGPGKCITDVQPTIVQRPSYPWMPTAPSAGITSLEECPDCTLGQCIIWALSVQLHPRPKMEILHRPKDPNPRHISSCQEWVKDSVTHPALIP